MNVTIDTLEIRSVTLPYGSSAISAGLIVAMAIYIVASLVSLFEKCGAHPVAEQYYSAVELDNQLDETL